MSLSVDSFRLAPQIYLSFSRNGTNIRALKGKLMFFLINTNSESNMTTARTCGAGPPFVCTPERKIMKSDCYLRMSVRMAHLGPHWTDIHEISYFGIFRIYVEKI